jgi:hypothetical protein
MKIIYDDDWNELVVAGVVLCCVCDLDKNGE